MTHLAGFFSSRITLRARGLFLLGLTILPCCAWAVSEGGPKKIRIVLVGDSTVTDHAGWGRGFKQLLTDEAECINTAQGGRSSKSFIDEGRLEKAIEAHGDYYLIQFGHNDQPGKGPARETDPATTYPEYMTRYIDAVRAIGAQPILVTSLVRRNFDPANPGEILTTLTPYAEAVKKLGAEKHVAVIDLHARSLALCERLGAAKTASFNPVKEGKTDTTHLDARGSLIFAALIAEDLVRAVPTLAPVFKKDLMDYAAISATQGDTEAAAAAAAGAFSGSPMPAEPKADAIVSADNSGTHLTVSAAVAAAPAKGSKPFVILVKPGVYTEHVHIPADKPFITLRGEPGETAATVITGDTNLKTIGPKGGTLPTRQSATVLVQGANFTAENITFENTTTREARVQALAIYVEADRAAFRGCRFIGWQDTFRADKGRLYLRDCYVSGHVDFIYGSAVAVFDHCEIFCRADGYITAASTPADRTWGFVFLGCRVMAAPEVEKGIYLGRPWGPHAATAFVRTELPGQIRPQGWHNWNQPEREPTVRYREYENTGPGAAAGGRVSWARALTEDEAAGCTVDGVLRGDDGWEPAKAFSK